MSRFHHFRIRTVSRCLLLLAACVLAVPPYSGGHAPAQRSATATSVAVPAGVLRVYRHVLKTGRPPAGYVGGRIWHNRERLLPPGRKYREFDVHPRTRGQNRGAERIIIDDVNRTGWYTGDHYRTFVLIDPP